MGAYPSAIHVRWVPPKWTGFKPISAIAVENEPTVFWEGADADERVRVWKERYFEPAWGEVTPAKLNGPSGTWLTANVRGPLREAGAGRHFVTDCLTTYRLSTGAASRLADTYELFVRQSVGLESADLQGHPTEAQIVREALQFHAPRITKQIEAARPGVVVTLGNAASRVTHALGDTEGSATLRPDVYGDAFEITLSGRRLRWVALVHPATPQVWQERHQTWLNNGGFKKSTGT